MLEVTIDGATCGGCVKSIEKAIAQVQGVTSVRFDLDSKLAKIEGSTEKSAVVDAIEMAGFDVIETDANNTGAQ